MISFSHHINRFITRTFIVRRDISIGPCRGKRLHKSPALNPWLPHLKHLTPENYNARIAHTHTGIHIRTRIQVQSGVVSRRSQERRMHCTYKNLKLAGAALKSVRKSATKLRGRSGSRSWKEGGGKSGWPGTFRYLKPQKPRHTRTLARCGDVFSTAIVVNFARRLPGN